MKTFVSALALVAVAGVAQGVTIFDVNTARITATPIDGVFYAPRDTGIIYDSSTTPSSGGTTVTAGQTIVEDYVSVGVDPTNQLLTHVFAGGVATANHVLFFNFYNAGGNFTGGYGVRLPQAGNFVWTITINPFGPGGEVIVPSSGFAQMVPDSGANNAGGVASTVTWRFTASAPTVGTTAGTVYRQAINVPAPGAMALIGMGGLLASRRRR